MYGRVKYYFFCLHMYIRTTYYPLTLTYICMPIAYDGIQWYLSTVFLCKYIILRVRVYSDDIGGKRDIRGAVDFVLSVSIYNFIEYKRWYMYYVYRRLFGLV